MALQQRPVVIWKNLKKTLEDIQRLIYNIYNIGYIFVAAGGSMVSVFILYYLNIKPTHGYEIQKFIQLAGIERWTRIQSGSIYYALTKLEKNGFIKVLREERTGSRVRKIYMITESGKEELSRRFREELGKPLASIGSMKFFVGPMLNSLKPEDIRGIVNKHLQELRKEKETWENWYQAKVNEKTTQLTNLSFLMTIDNLKYQILWHEELLEHLEDYINEAKETERFIKSIDFDRMEAEKAASAEEQKLQYAKRIRDEILKDPANAIDNLNRMISELEKRIRTNGNNQD